jgi:hypothetical protein
MRVLTCLPTLAAVALVIGGCSRSSDEKRVPATPRAITLPGVVLYGIGVSTDPYGTSSPSGFGVVTRLAERRLAKVELRGAGWCAERGVWIGRGKLLVPQRVPKGRSCGRLVIFRYEAGHLERAGQISVPAVASAWTFSLSRDGKLVADEPSVPCCHGGQRPGGVIFVAHVDGSRRREVARGHLAGWTPDGRVLFSTGSLFEFIRGDFFALELTSRSAATVLSYRSVAKRARVPKAEIAPPVWSADRRYLAARALLSPRGTQKQVWAVAIAWSSGRIIRVLRSPHEISMLAWSPRGHRLAYTTSGFPAPHELYVVDHPDAEPKRLFMAARHVDWITWSPSGTRLLLDDEHADTWQLLDASGARTLRALPRLGGRPIWCCPQNEFSTR